MEYNFDDDPDPGIEFGPIAAIALVGACVITMLVWWL